MKQLPDALDSAGPADSSDASLTRSSDAVCGIFARYGLAHARTRMPLLIFVGMMLMLSLERLMILVGMSDRYAQAAGAEVLWAFLVGIRFDAVIACMVAAPMLAFFALAMPRVITSRVFRATVALYGGGVLALSVLLCVSDYFFYQEFGSRLNHNAIHYLSYDYVWWTILDQYPVGWAAIATLGVFAGGAWATLRWGFADRYNVGPIWQAIVWPALAAGMLVLGIRGGLGPKGINTAPAYFSGDPVVTQLSLNGMFTLREAISDMFDKQVEMATYYDPLPQEVARELVVDLVMESGDEPLGDVDNPLRRVTDTGRPRRDHNVVLVVMESMSWHYIGALGGEPDYTPNLNRLADGGILMERCFAVGGRTTRGMCGIVSGFPDLPGDSVTTRQAGHRNFFTIANVLRDRDYETLFIYGGQPHYDHRQAYFGGNGFSRFVFEDQFSTTTFRTHLGWCDGDLFTTAHDQLTTIAETGDKPFFALMLTLGFHRDYKIPQGVLPPLAQATGHEFENQIHAVRYTDWAIGRFMEQARSAPYFDNTIFVFVADHSGGFLSNEPSTTSYRVPFLIYAPKIVGAQGRRITATCSQMDVAPTILSLLGGSFAHTFFGSSVLDRPAERGRALIQTADESLVLVDAQGIVSSTPPHGAEPRIAQFVTPDRLIPLDTADTIEMVELKERSSRMSQQARAMLQMAECLFASASYNLGPRAGQVSGGVQHTHITEPSGSPRVKPKL